MKQNSYKFSSTLLFLLLISVSVVGQSFTKQKTVERSFPMADDTEIEISNKYGDITIENWEKDSVKVVIDYKVTSTKETKLNKTFDAINFDFKANEYYIVIATEFDGSGSFWSDVSEIASNLFAAGNNTSIDYKVFAPTDKRINIKLKYGNVYMTNHTGSLKLSLSNGDFKAHNLSGKTELDIVFGDASINSLSNGEIKISYGTLNLESADKLSIIGQSTEFEIGTVDELLIDSKRDKFNIEEVNTLSGLAYFSRINIDKVIEHFELSTKYGSLKLKSIKAGVDEVKLTSVNTTVNIYLHKNSNYFISLTSDDKADVTYSADIGDFSTEELPGKEKIMKAECVIGIKKIAIPIIIDIKAGFLSIKLDD